MSIGNNIAKSMMATFVVLLAGCSQTVPVDLSDTSGEIVIRDWRGMLSLVNDQGLADADFLDRQCGLRSDAALNVVAHRDGPDGIPATGDDDLFNTLDELDGVAGVGPSAMESLYRCAAAFDYLFADRDGLLAFVNDPYLATFDRLDGECGLRSDSARNIVAHRDGQDGRHGTGDDDPFNDLQELDSLPMVGLDTIGALYTCAERAGVVVDWIPPGTTQVLVVPSLEALDGALREVVLEDLWFRARNMSGAVSPEDVFFSKAEIYYSGTKVAGYMVEFDALQRTEGPDDGTASHFAKVSFLLDEYFQVSETRVTEASGTATP